MSRGLVTEALLPRRRRRRFSTADSSCLCLGPTSGPGAQPGSHRGSPLLSPANLLREERKREQSRTMENFLFSPRILRTRLWYHPTASQLPIITRFHREPRFCLHGVWVGVGGQERAMASSEWVWNSFHCHCPRPQPAAICPQTTPRLLPKKKKEKKAAMQNVSRVPIRGCGHARTPRPAKPRPKTHNLKIQGARKIRKRFFRSNSVLGKIKNKKACWIMLQSEPILPNPPHRFRGVFSPFRQEKRLAPSSTSCTHRGCSKCVLIFFLVPFVGARLKGILLTFNPARNLASARGWKMPCTKLTRQIPHIYVNKHSTHTQTHTL